MREDIPIAIKTPQHTERNRTSIAPVSTNTKTSCERIVLESFLTPEGDLDLNKVQILSSIHLFGQSCFIVKARANNKYYVYLREDKSILPPGGADIDVGSGVFEEIITKEGSYMRYSIGRKTRMCDKTGRLLRQPKNLSIKNPL